MRFPSRSLVTAILAGGVALVPTWAASGRIAASPNPCGIAPGAHVCTSYITWTTQGTTQARVYVTELGKKNVEAKEFGVAANCKDQNCPAKWIEQGASYVFTLYDYSSGKQGAVLGSIGVSAVPLSGKISATPNPCKVGPGKFDCTAYVTWSTEGAMHAVVFVSTSGKTRSSEREFASGRACVAGKCPASWIEPGTHYLFTLYDFSSGSRGPTLGSVTVDAIK